MPNSLEIVKGTIAPLSTLVLGLLTYNVSRYQKNIQKEKIISDLFTRRIEVYDAFLDAICLIAFNYNASIHDYDELKIVQKQYNYARFLFEEEAYSKLTSIKCDIFEYHFKAQFQNKAIGPSVNETEHDMQVKKRLHDINVKMQKLLEGEFANLFDPYMSIKDFRNRNYTRISKAFKKVSKIF